MTGAIRSELFKLKNSGLLYLALVGTIITNVLFAMAAIYLPAMSTDLLGNPLESWTDWINYHYQGIMTMLLPMFLVILCALSVLMENRSNMWKSLYSLPIARSTLYLSKIAILVFLFALAHLIFVILMWVIPSLLTADLALNTLPFLDAFNLYVSTVISSLGIMGIVFLISYYSKSFVLPLAVGILGFVTAELLSQNGLYSSFFPFAHPTLTIDSLLEHHKHQSSIYMYSALWFLISTIIGIVRSKRDWKKFY